MTQGNPTPGSAAQPVGQEAQKKFASPLPDGIGLTLAQAKALVAEHNKTVIADDEPALIELTILNAFLGELEKLQTRHKEGLGRLMADKTDAYVSGVAAAVAQLTDSLSSASVEGIRKVFDDHAARLQVFKNSTTWLAVIVAVSALLNVAVFALKAVR
ncbi:hypothetical protein HMPREF1022_00559 [Desulfovibrio sp. 6_1_46AFAA]|uniref:hypothetical protein n=1 Tax=Desulfovibrio sp. 6_1_46AFAA TaxID=665942 RepID=UPI0002236BCA|nr:hypothetical protein [Desulfovibrio sp. 6_1_46AFAA]EGW52481.1 hypothetical protein HMPREF1022_00559 [Desulfovibrio sp. 6_1_46AFAA]